MKRLLSATLLLGLSGLGGLVIGLVRTKLLSSLLGPGGVGVFGNLTNLLNLLVVVASLGLSTGMVRFISGYRSEGSTDKTNRVLSGAFWIQGVLALLIAGLLVAFPEWAAGQFLGESALASTLPALALALPLGVVTAWLAAVMQGAQALSRLAAQSLAGLAAGLLVTFVLVLGWGREGAVWSIPAANAVILLTAWIICRPVWKLERLRLLPSLGKGLFGEVFWLGFAIFFCGALYYATMQLLRSRLLACGGEESVGFFHGGLQVVGYFYILAQALTLYLVPRMGEKLEAGEVQREVNQAWRLGTLCVALLAPILVLFGDLAVRLLLAKTFGPVTQFLPLLAASELIRIGTVVLGSMIIARGHRGTYVLVNLCFVVPTIVLGWLWIPLWGLAGAVLAYILGWLLNAMALVVAARMREGIELWLSNLAILVEGLVLIGVATFAQNWDWPWRLPVLAVFIAIMAFSVKSNEYRGLWRLIQQRLGRVASTE